MAVVRGSSRGTMDSDVRAAHAEVVDDANENRDGRIPPPDAPRETRITQARGVSPQPNDSDAAPAVLTVDELAALLRVERKTAYAAIARGEIPGVRRIGGVIRVSRDAVLAWLAQGQGRVSRSRRPS